MVVRSFSTIIARKDGYIMRSNSTSQYSKQKTPMLVTEDIAMTQEISL